MKKALFIIIAASVLLLASCVNTAPASNTATAALTAQTEEETEGIVLVCDGQSAWRVVRPEVCSDELLYAAKSVDAHLFNRLEVHLINKNDLAEPVENEILVGNTNRPQSQKVISGLGENEYAVVFEDGKIVIAGGGEKALIKAVEWFNQTYIDRAKRPQENETASLVIELPLQKRGFAN